MKKLFAQIGSVATKIESWLSLLGLVAGTGLFSWLASQWAWLADQGWAAVILVSIVCSCFLITSVSLTYFFLKRLQISKNNARDETDNHIAQERDEINDLKPQIYEGSHEKLMLFIVDNLIPTCTAIVNIRAGLIRHVARDEKIAFLAENGLSYVDREFHQPYERLLDLCGSPSAFIPHKEMIECVAKIEINYTKYGRAIDDMAIEYGVSLQDNEETAKHFKIWAIRNEELIRAYEAIKRDSRQGKLFRPARMHRWGQRSPVSEGNPRAMSY
ncbi:MAG: hypothetical protein RLW87_00285 [Alphaproteobacteria bacterium]